MATDVQHQSRARAPPGRQLANSLWGGRASPAQLQAKLDAGHFPSHKQFWGRILPLCRAGHWEQLSPRQVAPCEKFCEAQANWKFECPVANLPRSTRSWTC